MDTTSPSTTTTPEEDRLVHLFDKAFDYVNQHRRRYTRPTVVFDIDNTLVWHESVRAATATAGQSVSSQEPEPDRVVYRTHPVQPAVSFVQRIQTLRHPEVTLVFLTARQCDGQLQQCDAHVFPTGPCVADMTNLSFTRAELESIGCWHPQPSSSVGDECKLFVMPRTVFPSLHTTTPYDCGLQTSLFKTTIRNVLEKRLGHTILLNIGDQPTDHTGLHFANHLCYQAHPLRIVSTSTFS